MCERCPSDALRVYSAPNYRPYKDILRKTAFKAAKILGNPSGVRALKRDRFELNLPPSQVGGGVVYWRLGKWNCTKCGGEPNQSRPCYHMVALFLHLGLLHAPDKAPSLPDDPRDQSALDQSKRNMEGDFPRIARRLVETVPEWPTNPRGASRISVRDLLIGALAYAVSGQSLRETESRLKIWQQLGFVEEVPSYGLLSSFLASPQLRHQLDRLLLVSAMAVRDYTYSGGPDGTGFQRHNFYSYGEERRRRNRAADDPEAKVETSKRTRRHILAIPLIMYETNVVPALVVRPVDPLDGSSADTFKQDGFPNGEAPYFLGLLERVRAFFPQLAQVRADRGYFAFRNYLWGELWGINVQIPPRANYVGSASGKGRYGAGKAAYKAITSYQNDVPAHLAAYHKRSQQEGVMNGVKVEMGGGVRLRGPDSQFNEIRLKYVAWNLKQVNYERYHRASAPGLTWEPDFLAQAHQADAKPLATPEELARKYQGSHAAQLMTEEARSAGRAPCKDPSGESATA